MRLAPEIASMAELSMLIALSTSSQTDQTLQALQMGCDNHMGLAQLLEHGTCVEQHVDARLALLLSLTVTSISSHVAITGWPNWIAQATQAHKPHSSYFWKFWGSITLSLQKPSGQNQAAIGHFYGSAASNI